MHDRWPNDLTYLLLHSIYMWLLDRSSYRSRSGSWFQCGVAEEAARLMVCMCAFLIATSLDDR